MRVLLFTGKGGVGKTTTAAATAYHTAKLGYKTLVISTDPAHSLSDALNTSLRPEPVEVHPNLFAQELDVYYSMKKYWQNTKHLLLALFKMQGFQNMVAEELSALPGMEEASAFLWIEKYYSEKAYEVIIIDSAPTGETLTLLSVPQVAQWWTSKAFPFQKLTVKTVGAAVRTFTGIPLDKGYEELEVLFDKLEKVQKLFANPEICSIRVVVNPEKMVINEAKRAYTYLQMYGYVVDAVIINRIIPELENAGVFSKYLENQVGYIRQIEEDFAPLPIFKVPHQGQEVFGLERLALIAETLYKEKDPLEVYQKDLPMQMEEKGSDYLLRLRIPFLDQNKAEVHHVGTQLTVQIGNQRRNFFLPQFLQYYDLKNYFQKKDQLVVQFRKKAD